MPFTANYAATEPLPIEIQSLPGLVLLEFGADWCGYCHIAQPLIQQALGVYHQVHHIKLADGKGRPMGRTYGVKLWPTLVLLRDGVEIGRLTRPRDARIIENMLAMAASQQVD